MTATTRETWLNSFTQTVRPWFEQAGYPLPEKIRISCGLPYGRAFGPKRAIGQCWSIEASADGTTEIFISPTISDGLTVTATMIHELAHCAVGVDKGHKGPFKACAKALGLTGKMTATTASQALEYRLLVVICQMICTIGPYPHAPMDYSKRKKQGTRLLKAQCLEHGYTVRVTQKWIDEAGAPLCPICGVAMGLEGDTEGECRIDRAAQRGIQ